jgi:hypothetical protein
MSTKSEVIYDSRGGQFHCWVVILNGKVAETFSTVDAAYDYLERHR